MPGVRSLSSGLDQRRLADRVTRRGHNLLECQLCDARRESQPVVGVVAVFCDSSFESLSTAARYGSDG